VVVPEVFSESETADSTKKRLKKEKYPLERLKDVSGLLIVVVLVLSFFGSPGDGRNLLDAAAEAAVSTNTKIADMGFFILRIE